MLTVKEAAIKLKVSGQTVLKLIKSGDLSSIKVGRQFRITHEAVNTYIIVQVFGLTTKKGG